VISAMEEEKIEELDKDGFLFKRFGSKMKKSRIGPKWNYYYFNLMGGSLHYYSEIDVSNSCIVEFKIHHKI
jgi:hypothetical protein